MLWTVVMEKTFESPLDCKEIQPVNAKGQQSWIFIVGTDVEAEAPRLWPPDAKSQLTGKNPDAGKDWREEEKGTKENEMVGWHHWTRVLANSRRMWRTGKPGVLQSMGSQRVGHDLPTEQQQLYLPTPLECDFPDCKTQVCYIEHCTLRLACCLENKRCSHIW